MMNKQLSPGYFNVFILFSIVLHFLFPIKTIIHSPYTYSGLVFILLGLGLNLWAVNLLKKEKTAVEFHDTPQKLVVGGPFSLSRNPIYLGGVILLIGLAVFLGSMISFIFPVLLFLILNGFYIPVEEKRLLSIFGEEYQEYRYRVRRWI